MTDEEPELAFISPRRETLTVSGSLFYSESRQAWSIIRMKKEILHEYPQLKHMREKFGYMMVIHRTFKDLKKAIAKMEKDGGVVPILLLFGKERGKS